MTNSERVAKQTDAPIDPIADALELAAKLDRRSFEEVMRYASPLSVGEKK